MSKKRVLRGLAYPPVKRALFPPDQPDLVYYETRGIHTFSIPAGNCTGQPADETTATARMLNLAARRLLERAGEPSLEQVLQRVRADDSDDNIELIRRELLTWYSRVGARWGFTSPVAMAAKFLGLLYLALGDVVDGVDCDREDAPEQMQQRTRTMFEFADAWHKLHMEIYGEHADVFEARQSEKNRAQGPAAARARKQRRNDLLRRVLVDAPDDRPSRLARYRFKTVNNVMVENGLPEYASQAALAKAIRRLKKSL